MKFIRKHIRLISAFLAIGFVSEIVFPLTAKAITGHNSMPEYTSFEPVGTTNMVNTFDGSFTYNIPLLDVPNGYPINLSYHSSGIGPESQASWVGLGWTLNPGAINRGKRGFPDDFNGENVKFHSRMPASWTLTGNIAASTELFGNELPVSLYQNVAYNNYKGISTVSGIQASIVGILDLNLNFGGGRLGFSPEINTSGIFHHLYKKNTKDEKGTDSKDPVTEKKTALQEETAKVWGMMLLGQKVNRKENLKVSNSTTSQSQVNFSQPGVSGSVGLANFIQPGFLGTPAMRSFSSSLSMSGSLSQFAIPAPLDAEPKFSVSLNITKNTELSEIPAFGYLHTEAAEADASSMMDYYTELDKPYERSDKNIGIPFANADVFSFTGEGIGGSFRGFRKEFGHYRKNRIAESGTGVKLGADIDLPKVIPTLGTIIDVSFGLGANVGANFFTKSVGEWKIDGDQDDFAFQGVSTFSQSDENVVYRQNADKAGAFDYVGDHELFSADLVGGSFPMTAEVQINNWSTSSSVSGNLEDKRTSRSNQIVTNTNQDALEISNGVKYKLFEKNLKVLDNSSSPVVQDYDYTAYNSDGICEISSVNQSGVRYVYGLPVYTQNEKNLTYSLKPDEDFSVSTLETTGKGIIANVSHASGSADLTKLHEKSKFLNGTEIETAYSTQHLLTQIQSPDYIDRTQNGPTPDDFGNYTKLNYERVVGGSGSDWYQYRSPFKGLSYTYGDITNKNDNMGSFSAGEKELYYLNSIVSKTHVAIFYTSDTRKDGKGVNYNTSNPTPGDYLLGDQGAAGTGTTLRKLDKIELYPLSDVSEISPGSGFYTPNTSGKPIKTVHFSYDYTLCKGTPNSSDPNGGKLTLKKIWFEYEGKMPSRLPAYDFGYEYPAPANYPVEYSAIGNFYSPFSSQAQNPDYSELNSNRWGDLRDFSTISQSSYLGDLARFFPFVYQNPDYLSGIDPAAYRLKQIKLPSGGEIHVQYEANDYQYVQDKKAMVMVPLSDATSQQEQVAGKEYYLNLEHLGIDFNALTSQEKDDILLELFEPMLTKGDRTYFSFLYGIIGEPDFRKYNSEFIEGYARINGFGYKNVLVGGVNKDMPFITFKDGSGANFTEINYGGSEFSKRELPKKVCQEFFRNNLRGKLGGGSNGILAVDEAPTGEKPSGLFDALKNLQSAITPAELTCSEMKPEMSYIRVQSPIAKKGGGVRVKRLLMYDGTASTMGVKTSLYGNEYDYTTSDNDGKIISSGVATNEPQSGRRESALIHPLDRVDRNLYESILYGREMYNQEGPIAENMLPSASVGYSKVTISNIHQGATTTGKEEHLFYTVKDFPMTAKFTDIASKFKIKTPAIGLGATYSRHAPHMAQGYLVENYQMHGMQHKVSKFSGGTNPKLIAEQETYYEEPGGSVQIMDENYSVTSGKIGHEVEILAEEREVSQSGVDFGFQIDASFFTFQFLFQPLPVFYSFINPGVPQVAITDNLVRTHVTNKIITYPPIVKKVRNFADGVNQYSENLVYDKFSGEPIVTKSYDDFTGTYMNQAFMADWEYPEMGPKYLNEGLIEEGVVTWGEESGRPFLKFTSSSTCGIGETFSAGDLLLISTLSGTTNPCGTNEALLYHIDGIVPGQDKLFLQKSGMAGCNLAPGNHNLKIEVLRSGKTNELATQSGSLMAHDENGNVPYVTSGITIPGLLSNQAFANDLNAAIDAATASGIPTGTVMLPTMAGPYSDMSLSIDPCFGDASCDGSGAGATISNVKIEADFQPGSDQFSLKVVEVGVIPTGGGTLQTVQCSGYDETPLYTTNLAVNRTGCDVGACPRDQPDNTQPIEVKVFEGPHRPMVSRTCYKWDNYMPFEVIDLLPNTQFWEVSVQKPGTPAEPVHRSPAVTGRMIDLLSFTPPGYFEGSATLNFYKWEIREYRTNSTLNRSGSGTFRVGLAEPYGFQSVKYSVNGGSYLPLPVKKRIEPGTACPWTIGFDLDFGTIPQTYDDYPYTVNYLINGQSSMPGVTITPNANNEDAEITFDNGGVYMITAEIVSAKGKCTKKFISYVILEECGAGGDPLGCKTTLEGEDEFCLDESGGALLPTTKTYLAQQEGATCSRQNCKWYLIDPNGNGGSTPIFTTCKLASPTFTQAGIYTLRYEYEVPNPAPLTGVTTYTKNYAIDVKDCRIPEANIVATSFGCPGKLVKFEANPIGDTPIDSYTWDFGNGQLGTGQSAYNGYVDCSAPYTVTLTVANENGSTSSTHTLNTGSIPECHEICACESYFSMTNHSAFVPGSSQFSTLIGGFLTDPNSKQFVYKEAGCDRIEGFDCIKPCSLPGFTPPAGPTQDKILAASASLFSDAWWYNESAYNPDPNFTGNDFEKGYRGKWRPYAQYAYRTQTNRDRNYNSGHFTLEIFDWKTGNIDPEKWVLASTTTQYDPNGNPVEDKNILNVYSAGKFGYNHTLPVLVAQNSQRDAVAFEGFEQVYAAAGGGTNQYFEDGLIYNPLTATRTDDDAHTGIYSMEINPGKKFRVGEVTVNSQVMEEGLMVRAWLKVDRNKPILDGKVTMSIGRFNMPMERIATSGQWHLFEAIVEDFAKPVAVSTSPGISGVPVSSPATGAGLAAGKTPVFITVDGNEYEQGDVLIDDTRLQPFQAEMACYVYDHAQRLVASFDDQHFAMLYEYNSEGQLVRKLKETTRGVKTISETQYNVPGQPR